MSTGFFKYFVLAVLLAVYVVHEGVCNPTPNIKRSRPFNKFDGDIILDESTLRRLHNPDEPNLEPRNTVRDKNYHWPNGVVPYVFDLNFDAYPDERARIQGAINEIHKVSCVRFVQRSSEQYYLKFTRGSDCSSLIGYQRKSPQLVSIGKDCRRPGTVAHELLHALGFFHTSSRPDRDSYVVIYKDNIAPGKELDFWKLRADGVDDFGAPFEMTSLMQLPRHSFAKEENLETIVARKGKDVVLGNSKMTKVDIGQLNTLYKCSASKYPVCYQSLGMKDGRIKDSQLTASSHQRWRDPHQARLHLTSSSKGSGAWCPTASRRGEWLKIDLGSYKYIIGIATQGMVNPFEGPSWVTHYSFHFSYNDAHWYNYATWVPSGLSGNWDEFSVQYNRLPVVISARYLRIEPSTWKNGICMRVEVYGCNYS